MIDTTEYTLQWTEGEAGAISLKSAGSGFREPLGSKAFVKILKDSTTEAVARNIRTRTEKGLAYGVLGLWAALCPAYTVAVVASVVAYPLLFSPPVRKKAGGATTMENTISGAEGGASAFAGRVGEELPEMDAEQAAAMETFVFAIAVLYGAFADTGLDIFSSTLRVVWANGPSTSGPHVDGVGKTSENEQRSIHQTSAAGTCFVSEAARFLTTLRAPPCGVGVSDAFARNNTESARRCTDLHHWGEHCSIHRAQLMFDHREGQPDKVVEITASAVSFLISLASGYTLQLEKDASHFGIYIKDGIPAISFAGREWRYLQGAFAPDGVCSDVPQLPTADNPLQDISLVLPPFSERGSGLGIRDLARYRCRSRERATLASQNSLNFHFARLCQAGSQWTGTCLFQIRLMRPDEVAENYVVRNPRLSVTNADRESKQVGLISLLKDENGPFAHNMQHGWQLWDLVKVVTAIFTLMGEMDGETASALKMNAEVTNLLQKSDEVGLPVPVPAVPHESFHRQRPSCGGNPVYPYVIYRVSQLS